MASRAQVEDLEIEEILPHSHLEEINSSVDTHDDGIDRNCTPAPRDVENGLKCPTNNGGNLPTAFYKTLMDANWVELKLVGEFVPRLPEFLRHFSDASSAPRKLRVYQFWPGNNVFFFRGHIICGPDIRGFLLTTVSIVLSAWILCTYIDDRSTDCYAIVFVSALVLTAIVLVSLVMVGTRDPGIIPRNKNPQVSDTGTSYGTRSRRVIVNGVEVKQKYCKVCMLFRPPRSCHCTICNNCVEKFDHHCPWIGQCIGLRNYRFYIMFVFSTLVFYVYTFAISWQRITRLMLNNSYRFLSILANAPETIALALFSFISAFFLGGLAIFHGYLVTQNQTARENFKQQYRNSPNRYDKGILMNIREALFRRLPPSNVNFREEVNHNPRSSKPSKELHEVHEMPKELIIEETQDSAAESCGSERYEAVDTENTV